MPINYFDMQRFEAVKVRENIRKWANCCSSTAPTATTKSKCGTAVALSGWPQQTQPFL